MSQLISMDNLVVRSRGEVSVVERGYGRERFARVIERSPLPVHAARMTLVFDRDSGSSRATADGELDLSGRTLRATSSADTIFDAIHKLERAIEVTLRAVVASCGVQEPDSESAAAASD
jgi:hypothetical protein